MRSDLGREWKKIKKELEDIARRGPKVDPNAVELARLQRENKRLQEQLQRAELIIDVQKKVARLLGVPLADHDLSKDS